MHPDADDYLHDAPAPVTLWQRLNRLIGVLIVLAVVAGIIGAFLPQLQRQRDADAEERRLELQVEQGRKRVARQTRELGWLKNDPTYVEIIARERLDVMKEGETIYRLEQPKTPTPRPPATPPEPAPKLKRATPER